MLLAATNATCVISYINSNKIEKNLDSTKEANKKQMLLANNDMSDRLKVLKESSKLEFLNEFGKYWRIKLQEIKKIDNLRININKDFESLCPLFFFGLYFAFIDLLYPLKIITLSNFSIYPSHVGWLFILIAIILQYFNQFSYRGVNEKRNKYYNVTIKNNKQKSKIRKESRGLLNKGLQIPVFIKKFKGTSFFKKKIFKDLRT